MAEASRKDAPLMNPQYPQGATGNPESFSSPGVPKQNLNPESSLPPGVIYGNSRLHRSAHALGYGAGKTWLGVRQFPRRIDEARSRLRVASGKTRANASAALFEMMESASERANRLRRSARENVSHIRDTTRLRVSELGDRAADRWQDFLSMSRQRVDYACRRAEAQWTDTRLAVERLQRENPVKFLGVIAGAAFLVGAGLRIWKESHE